MDNYWQIPFLFSTLDNNWKKFNICQSSNIWSAVKLNLVNFQVIFVAERGSAVTDELLTTFWKKKLNQNIIKYHHFYLREYSCADSILLYSWRTCRSDWSHIWMDGWSCSCRRWWSCESPCVGADRNFVKISSSIDRIWSFCFLRVPFWCVAGGHICVRTSWSRSNNAEVWAELVVGTFSTVFL